MKYLIGNSGLVGKTLLKTISFDATFNSSNIHTFETVFAERGDVILTCLPATKWLVNQNKLKDLQNIYNIINILSKCKFQNITLISTIDVYLDSPLEVDESYEPTIKTLHYGTNRFLFEKMVKDILHYETLHIFRLPALFGEFIKKNIIFDLLHNNNIKDININTYYQWYNLNRLNADIELFTKSYKNGIFNLFPEPIYTADIIDSFFANSKVGYKGAAVKYDWRTQYNSSGYIQTAQQVMNDLQKFINETRNK